MNLRKIIPILVLLAIQFDLYSQKLGVDYTTAIDSTDRQHFMIFREDGTVIVKFPFGPGISWGHPSPAIFGFSNKLDTIFITKSDSTLKTDDNKVLLRVLHSKFVIRPHNQLYDLNSGFTYVDYKRIKRYRYGAISIDDKIYLLRKHRQSFSLNGKIKRLNLDLYESNLIRGKQAFDKYGLKGIYGVVEIIKK
jgi:hypothetical protein